MRGADESEAVLQAIDRLGAELGYAGGGEILDLSSAPLERHWQGASLLDAENELLVTRVRQGLARIGAALAEGEPDDAKKRAAAIALDGAELVTRGALLRGKPEELPGLIPTFVFLVALSIADEDEAIALSRRTSDLIDEGLRDPDFS